MKINTKAPHDLYCLCHCAYKSHLLYNWLHFPYPSAWAEGDLALVFFGGTKIFTLKICEPNFPNDLFRKISIIVPPKILMTFF